MADEPSAVWIMTDVAPDGSYVVTLVVSDDRARTLSPDESLRYAAAVFAVAEQASYDAAVLRQLTEKLGVTLDAAAQVVKDLRADRPPLHPDATSPLRLEPGVGSRSLRPFLTISLDGVPLGEWTVDDAHDHAVGVLSAVAVVELDAAYHRVLTGMVGLDEDRARRVVADIANWRGDPSQQP